MPIDPVTGITIPEPGIQTGPQYATDVSEALEILAHLRHTGEANQDGYQIPAAGLDIDDDVSMQSNNLIDLRSTRYDDQALILNGVGDLDCVYFKDGDLWINNGDGYAVQVTSGQLVNATVPSVYVPVATSGNLTINSGDSTIFVECDSSGGAIIVTLPLAAEVPEGRFYFIKDVAGSSETNNISVTPNGTDTIDGSALYQIGDNFAAVAVVSDGIGNWMLLEYNRKVYGSGETIQLTDGAALTSDAASPVTLQGSLETDDIECNGNIHVDGTAILDTTLDVGQDLTVGQDMTVTGSTQVGVDLSVGGDAVITGVVAADSFQFSAGISSVVRVSRDGGISDATNWSMNGSWLWENNVLGTNMAINMTIPNGVRVTSVSVSIQPDPHPDPGALPTNMPSIAFKKYNNSTGATTAIASQTDTSANITAYNLRHSITISGLTEVVDAATYVYWMVLTAESAGTAITGTQLLSWSVTYDRLSNSKVGED